ncbi:MAG: PAS domain S-box protein, partial [Anaerolineae bacterium]
MGEERVRVLLVEDNRADQMAVERLVKKEGLPYDLVIAETVAEAIARLKEGRLDVALIDYRLPDGSGLEVQEHVGDTPCIFITGAANQAVAVQAMKAGAFDFLVKDQARDYLALLPVTIENAIRRKQDEDELWQYREHLEEMVEQRTARLKETNEQLHAEIAGHRRTEAALRESEARFRVLTEHALAGVYLVQDDRFRYVNPALAAMFGYTPEELIGRLGSLNLTAPEDRDRVTENMRRRDEGEVDSVHYTFRGLRKDGTLFECEVLGAVAEYAGRPAVLGMLLDITERVRAEQTMQRQTWELVTLNQIGRALSQLAPTDGILHQIYVAIGQVLSNDNLYIALYDELQGQLSFPVYTIEGQLRDPGISRPFGNGITEYVIRTKAPLCILSDLQETLVELGVDLMGRLSSSLLAVPILFGEKVLGVIALQDYQNENTYTSADVSLLSKIASQAAIAIENARLHENVQRELSRRKQAERTLQQIVEGTSSVVGEEFLRSLVKHLASILQTRFAFISRVVDPEGKRVALTAFWEGADYGECFEYDIEGTPCEQVVNKNLAFFPCGVQELFPDDLWLKEAGIVSYLAIPLFDSVGNALGHLGVMHDAPMQESYLARSTLEIFAARAVAELERKRAQDALRMVGQRYRDLFEEAPVMYVITRNQAGVPIVADCNQLFLDALGFDKTQVLGRPLADFYTPESRAELLEGGGYQRALEGQFGAEERNLLTRDGHVVVALLRALPETDFAGQVSGTRAAFVDITKRRQAETALKEYSERLEEMVEERTRNLRGAQEQLVRQEKLATLGQLAGGVAHELRNPLGAISNAAYYLNLVLEE